MTSPLAVHQLHNAKYCYYWVTFRSNMRGQESGGELCEIFKF